MGKKMTISELREFIQKKAIKMYAIHVLNEQKAILEKKLEKLDEAKFHNAFADTAEQTTDSEINDEIDMLMRPIDNTLAFSEINDIANRFGVDAEHVAQLMTNYVINRDREKDDNIKSLVSQIINDDFGGEAPDFKTFYARFMDYDEARNYGVGNAEPIRKIYDSMTKDPNQLQLDLQEAKKVNIFSKNTKVSKK